MIASTWLGALTVATASDPGRPRQVSAASGLVKVGDFLYVVADDENSLAMFPASEIAAGRLVRLFPGELPLDTKARKKRKPDLEALTLIPRCPAFPHGALLALPSGSRPNRRLGAVLGLDAGGGLVGAPRAIDLTGLYLALEARFPELNIEGAAISGDALVVLQRGNKQQQSNASIELPFAAMLEAIADGRPIARPESMLVRPADLGSIDGTALCFTDAALLDDGRMVFTAVAEASANSYEDGPCAGAAIGILARDGRVESFEQLAGGHKVEGVHAAIEDGDISLLLVTDADDPAVPSELRAARISGLPPARPAPAQPPG